MLTLSQRHVCIVSQCVAEMSAEVGMLTSEPGQSSLLLPLCTSRGDSQIVHVVFTGSMHFL